MSSLAATTGSGFAALASALAHRGHPQNSWNTGGIEAATLGRPSESQSFADEHTRLLLSGPVTAPLDILDLLDEDLEEGLRSLRGPGIALYQKGPTLVVSRDGAGGRSLNYSFARGQFSCASESKALLALPGHPRSLCPAAVARFLNHGFVPGPETLLAEVQSLPAGTYLKINLDNLHPTEPVRWFFPENGEAILPPETAAGAFATTLRQSVERLLVHAGASPGLFLSGTLDSCCVAAELARDHARTLQTYSLHFGSRSPDDLAPARDAVRFFGLNHHHEILIRPKEVIPRLATMIEALDEPIGDPSALLSFELAARTGKKHWALFTGEGGSLLFDDPANLPRLPDPHSRRQVTGEAASLLTPEFRELIDNGERPTPPIVTPGPEPPHDHDDARLAKRTMGAAQLVQSRQERMFAAHELRPLAPFFDENMIRLSLALSQKRSSNSSRGKLMMTEAFAKRLPESVLGHPARRLSVPIRDWMKNDLRTPLHDLLSTRILKREGIFDHRRVRQLIKARTGDVPARQLWALMTFQLWKTRFGV